MNARWTQDRKKPAVNSPRLWMLMATLTMCMACPGPDDNDNNAQEDMTSLAPTPAMCEAIKTQRACFEAGCSFFATAVSLKIEVDMCAVASSFGQCLYTPTPQGPELLTSYQKKVGDETYAVQLGFDVDLPGWTRCGGVSVPPDCDCDGQ